MEKLLVLGICFALFLVVAGQKKGRPNNCQECHSDLCIKPKNCFAGVVKDRCDCCYICAQGEGQACDLSDSKYKYGSCGDLLECRTRNDVGPRRNLAICQCKKQGAVCGTNDVTYDSECHMRADARKKDIDISPKYKHPCMTVPSIRSPPMNVKNLTRANVFLSCEATGYPIPHITWTWTNADREIIELPTDDLHVSVNSRGGPDKHMVTGWVQIMDLMDDHQGDYTCVAENEAGIASAVARVNVINPSRL